MSNERLNQEPVTKSDKPAIKRQIEPSRPWPPPPPPQPTTNPPSEKEINTQVSVPPK